MSGDTYLLGDGPTGVLVLSGADGGLDEQRCAVLARAGATAASLRWFGRAVEGVALESFDDALTTLHERCDRLVVLGTARGAEAALLLGVRHPEVDAVVAISPTDVVWAALTSARPQRSAWTSGGDPLPFVPHDDDWEPTPAEVGPPVSFRGLYEQSLETYADRLPAARIPVERIAGRVVLAAGGADAVWPSVDFADEIVQRRETSGLETTLVTHPEAGHLAVLPGEDPSAPSPRVAAGGDPEADAALGALLWPHLADLLRPPGPDPTRPDARHGATVTDERQVLRPDPGAVRP
ncbi:acyl-CoA thioester hydrolase/BAAT C-terminal domain-containing protein [Nocardioides sp. SYSU D00038]|uniref:acyl-CoA thioester hydrolase/BAAT C-terminal domain-containing protein n=1 Tax=Nocardioides sp. SYSU D00038 TaxID=2812554 RepID=UPI0019685DC4|nr:acyl-CoA thioester hydrolase/BAAT C-terminal domain-containing protein [Nocardioides sp. SYSU D00038]